MYTPGAHLRHCQSEYCNKSLQESQCEFAVEIGEDCGNYTV